MPEPIPVAAAMQDYRGRPVVIGDKITVAHSFAGLPQTTTGYLNRCFEDGALSVGGPRTIRLGTPSIEIIPAGRIRSVTLAGYRDSYHEEREGIGYGEV